MNLGNQTIGEWLAELRINVGRTRHEVAQRAGLNTRVVERVETGFHPNPQWETISAILNGIGVSSLTASYGRRNNEKTTTPHDMA